MKGNVAQTKRDAIPFADMPHGHANGDKGNWMSVSMRLYDGSGEKLQYWGKHGINP
jgi:hypothetical protein